jgi:hypothetical protein
MAKKPDQGHPDAHTRADPPAIDADPAAPGADAELPGADPADLLAGLPDASPEDLFAMAAEPALHQRRARGRPAGSLNRKNNDMIAYLQAKGHRDPWETLSLIQSADTMKLAMFLRVPMQENGVMKRDGKGNILYNPPDPQFVAALQERAATTLMKFHHSAKPQQLDLPPGGGGSNRPIMVIGDGNNVAVLAANGFASAEFLPTDESEGNQGVIDGEAVRQTPDKSHD